MFWARTCVTLITAYLAALAATNPVGGRIGPYHLEIRGINNQSINGTRSPSPPSPLFCHLQKRTPQHSNSSIPGNAGACHAGAAVEGLCYEAGAAPVPSKNYYNFYYTYGSYDLTTGVAQQPGWISWFLQIGGDASASLIESAMRLEGSWGSNLATSLFYPDTERGVHLYFVPETGELYATGQDDRNATVAFPSLPQRNFTNFHLCYQFTGGYWYHSIAWVYALPPSNPTCEPVSLKLTAF